MPSSKKRKLPSHLHAVMGEANLRLARGDPTGAQKLCKEVIRQGVCMYVRKVMWCYQVYSIGGYFRGSKISWFEKLREFCGFLFSLHTYS